MADFYHFMSVIATRFKTSLNFKTGFSVTAKPVMFVILCLSTIYPTYSQQIQPKKTLKGKVVTQEKNLIIPLEYATVRLLSPKDSTMLAGTTTDEFGDFVFNLIHGKDFLLTVSCVGYQSIAQSVHFDEKEVVTQLKNIFLG